MTLAAQHTSELTPRGRVILLLFSLALGAAWMTGDDHARLAAALLAAPLVVDALWKGRRMPELTILPQTRRCIAGVPFAEQLQLHNTSSRRALLMCRIGEPRLSTRVGDTMVMHLPALGTVTVPLTCRARGRGRATSRTFVVVRTWPLGLVRQRQVIITGAPLISEPMRIDLDHELLQSAAALLATCAVERLAHGVEFHSLREYMPGEDTRRVHALRSASTGVLVRQVSADIQGGHSYLVLDQRRPAGMPAPRSDRHFEWAVSAAATLLETIVQAGHRVTLVLLGEGHTMFDAEQDLDTAMELLVDARSSSYQKMPAATFIRLEQAQTVLWVPAGGLRARSEMDRLQTRPVLVVQE